MGKTTVNLSPLTVAVIVPVYNGGAKFRASLDSIRRAVPPPDELIVVGDGDTDGSSQYAEAAGISVYRFPHPEGLVAQEILERRGRSRTFSFSSMPM